MRCFIAIDVETGEIEKLLNELSKIKAGIKVVEKENLHITLKFLGEVEENLVDRIHAELKEIENFESFEAELRGVDAFPNRNYMRVIFVKAEHERIYKIHNIVDEKLVKFGFAKDKRFKSHVTLCRVKSSINKKALADFIKKHESKSFGRFKCDRIRIKKSTLTRQGAIYETLKEIRLK